MMAKMAEVKAVAKDVHLAAINLRLAGYASLAGTVGTVAEALMQDYLKMLKAQADAAAILPTKKPGFD